MALPISIFMLFVTLPTLLLPSDVWDGVMIEYASEIKEYKGLKSWFFESTWYLQYYFVFSIIWMSELLKISYKNLNAITTFIIMAILLREVLIFSEKQIGLNKLSVQMTLMLAATFPAWSALLSSVLTFHLCCIAVGMLGIRAVHESLRTKKIIGFVLIFFAYSLQSQLVFLPTLSYVYDYFNKKSLRIFIPNPSIETILVFFLAGVFYYCVRVLYPPAGIFENYQTIIISSLAGLFPFILRGLHFLTYIIPISVGIFLYEISVITFREELKNWTELKKNQKKYPRHILYWILLMFLAGAFPYMAVGKSSIIWDVNDWNLRQAFLLVIPTSILAPLMLELLPELVEKKLSKNLIIAIACFLIAINSSLLLFGIFAKYSRQSFFNQLQEIIKEKESELYPGLLQIIVNDPPPTVFEYDEANFMMYKATGKSLWWARISDQIDPKFVIPCFVTKDTVYQKQHLYEPETVNVKYHTILTVHANGFSGYTNLIKNSFNINKQASIKVVSIQSMKLAGSSPSDCLQ
jgi:hypothetical protein